jgi:hypothetical protein
MGAFENSWTSERPCVTDVLIYEHKLLKTGSYKLWHVYDMNVGR